MNRLRRAYLIKIATLQPKSLHPSGAGSAIPWRFEWTIQSGCLELRFYVDPVTREPHITNHGINENEVREVLERPGEDRMGREGSRIAIGQTAEGRYFARYLRTGSGAKRGICDHCLRADGQTASSVPQAFEEETPMRQSTFPKGWDEARVRELLAYYEAQTEEEAVAEDETGVEPSETVMSVPYELVSQVRKLIAEHQR